METMSLTLPNLKRVSAIIVCFGYNPFFSLFDWKHSN